MYDWNVPQDDMPRSLIARLAAELEETIDDWVHAEGDGHKIADIDLTNDYDDAVWGYERRLLDEAHEWLHR